MSVQVQCPNAHRVKVDTNPNMPLFQILDEACLKQGFETENHVLYFKDRVLDLSLPFRLAAIPNNGNLEARPNALIVANAQATVCLEYISPDSKKYREQSAVKLKTNLYSMLSEFASKLGDKMVDVHENDGKNATIRYMRTEYTTKEMLETTTLQSMGIIGGNKVVLFYDRTTVSDDKLIEIREKLRNLTERRAKLLEIFKVKRGENLDRERVEKERERKFTEESAQANSVSESPNSASQSTSNCDSGANQNNQAQPVSRLDTLEARLTAVNSVMDTNEPIPENEVVTLAPQLRDDPTFMPFIGGFKFPVASKGQDLTTSQFAINDNALICDKDEFPVIDSHKFEARNVALFSMHDNNNTKGLSDNSMDTGNGELVADFFELKVDDVKKMIKSLKENKRLMEPTVAKQMHAHNRTRKAKAWKQTVIRYLLPSKYVLQVSFKSLESVQSLYDTLIQWFQQIGVAQTDLNLINDMLILASPPTVRLGERDIHLIDADLAPRANVTVQGLASLNVDWSAKLRNVPKKLSLECDTICEEILSENDAFVPWRPQSVDEANETRNTNIAGNSGAAGATKRPNVTQSANMPKWFKR